MSQQGEAYEVRLENRLEHALTSARLIVDKSAVALSASTDVTEAGGSSGKLRSGKVRSSYVVPEKSFGVRKRAPIDKDRRRIACEEINCTITFDSVPEM